MNDGRALPAKFEHDGCQSFGRRSHHDPPDHRAARKEYVIPRLFEKCRCLSRGAEYDRKRFGIQIFG